MDKAKGYHEFFFNLVDHPLAVYENTVKQKDIDSKVSKGMDTVSELQKLNHPEAEKAAKELQEVMDWLCKWIDLCNAMKDRMEQIGSVPSITCLSYTGHQLRSFSVLHPDTWMSMWTDFGRRLAEARPVLRYQNTNTVTAHSLFLRWDDSIQVC